MNTWPSQANLRQMIFDDLEMVLGWRNSPEVRRYMYNQHEITLKEHQLWFERSYKDSSKRLLIFENYRTALGFVSFTLHTCSSIADWGFYVAPGAPRGTGSQLGATALVYAFSRLELHKICGQVLSNNTRSLRFHRNLGFQQEGILRDQHFDGKAYHDVVHFGLLAPEWKPTI